MAATRSELLAEYYLKAASVAAIWIDPDGHVGAQDVARVQLEPEMSRLLPRSRLLSMTFCRSGSTIPLRSTESPTYS
jgi:hypothetical protein